MSILRMDTEQTENLVANIRQTTESIETELGVMRNHMNAIGGYWQGPSSQQFAELLANLAAQMETAKENGLTLGQRLSAEIAQWQETAAQLDGGAVAGGGSGGVLAKLAAATGPSAAYGSNGIKITNKATGFRAFEGPLAVSPNNRENSFHLNDISQGQLSDCYLMASLGSIANKNPEVLSNAIQDNQDGTYIVTFYEKNAAGGYDPIQVTVNNLLPVTKNGGLAYAAQGDNGELWPAIVEKAWAQHKGGYDKIEGGDPGKMLEALTGKPSTGQYANSVSLNQIATGLDRGEAVVFNTYTAKEINILGKIWDLPDPTDSNPMYVDHKLVPNHSYMVENADKNAGSVSIRNPWGSAFPPIVLTEKEFQESIESINTNPVK